MAKSCVYGHLDTKSINLPFADVICFTDNKLENARPVFKIFG